MAGGEAGGAVAVALAAGGPRGGLLSLLWLRQGYRPRRADSIHGGSLSGLGKEEFSWLRATEVSADVREYRQH